jgi:predicted nucleotidyltransferase
MTATFDASAIPDLDPIRDVLSEIQRRATSAGVEVMVVGATARDLLIHHALGLPPKRATRDVDIAVAVQTWSDVENLTNGLPTIGGGTHKFSVTGIEVDVVPFGSIESTDRTITFPDDHKMNVFGFEEAFAGTTVVRVSSATEIRVASIASQSLLKLMAWNDRRRRTTHDALDFRTILDAYSSGRYLDELYESHSQLLANYDFDPPLAAADRLGWEMGRTLGLDGRVTVLGLLQDDRFFTAFAADMDGNADFDRALLAAYRQGLARSGEEAR